VVFRKADEQTEAGALPSRELVDAMLAYNRQMIEAGVMLEGAGLRPSSEGVRVLFDGGKTSVVDGPFAETKELVAGYSLLETRTLDEAVEWLRRWPAEDAEGRARLEVRAVL
jgi:hypothetical protein